MANVFELDEDLGEKKWKGTPETGGPQLKLTDVGDGTPKVHDRVVVLKLGTGYFFGTSPARLQGTS